MLEGDATLWVEVKPMCYHSIPSYFHPLACILALGLMFLICNRSAVSDGQQKRWSAKRIDVRLRPYTLLLVVSHANAFYYREQA